MNTAVQSLMVSNPEGPLGKPEVRKALLMAIDRNGLVQAAASGYAKRTNSLTTESVWSHADPATKEAAFKDLEDYPYDVEAAAKIIKEQGVEGQEITITTAPISNDFAVISQATAAAAESIGLKAKINTVTPNAYTALFSDPEARKGTDLYFTSWYLSVADPQEMFSILRTDDFSNYGKLVKPRIRQVRQRGRANDGSGRALSPSPSSHRRSPMRRSRGCRSMRARTCCG